MEILFKLLLIPAYGKTVSVTSDDYGLFLVHFFYFSLYCKNCSVLHCICFVYGKRFMLFVQEPAQKNKILYLRIN